MLKTIQYVFYVECLLLLRRSHQWLYPLSFFLIVMSLFPLAFSPDPVFLKKFAPGCIWIAALLASLLSAETMFATDLEDGSIEQWLINPLPLPLLMLIKLSAQWLITQIPLILLALPLCILFGLPIEATLILCATLLLGTPILTLIGSIGITLTLGLQQQGTLLGLLLLPLVIPVLIFGVNIVQQSQAGLPILGPIAFLAGLSIFAIALLPYVTAVAMRLSFDD